MSNSPIYQAVLGRGLKPYSLWLLSIGLPTLALFWSLRKDESTASWAVYISAGLLAGWTIPPDTLGNAIVDIGRFRNHLADIIPVLPSIAHALPGLLYAVSPHLLQIAPHLGTVAPHLSALLPHAELLTRIIPKISTKLDVLLPVLEQVAPTFAQLDAEHMARLEIVLDDVVEKLDLLAPHIGALAPLMEDGILVADRMLPYIELVLPHLAALQRDIDWLLPFAEIEGVEQLLPLMDKIIPRLSELEPLAQAIRPHLPMLMDKMPIISENIDVLMDILPSMNANHMDPLLYWCGNLMPLANRMGILKSRALLKAAVPLAAWLPAVPSKGRKEHRAPAADAEAEGREWWRFGLLGRNVSIASVKWVGGTAYYVLTVDSRYAGEFRYKYVRDLYLALKPRLGEDAPRFPARSLFRPSAAKHLEARREMLERFLIYVLDDAKLVQTHEFIEFVRVRRRWAGDLPLLKSMLR